MFRIQGRETCHFFRNIYAECSRSWIQDHEFTSWFWHIFFLRQIKAQFFFFFFAWVRNRKQSRVAPFNRKSIVVGHFFCPRKLLVWSAFLIATPGTLLCRKVSLFPPNRLSFWLRLVVSKPFFAHLDFWRKHVSPYTLHILLFKPGSLWFTEWPQIKYFC